MSRPPPSLTSGIMLPNKLKPFKHSKDKTDMTPFFTQCTYAEWNAVWKARFYDMCRSDPATSVVAGMLFEFRVHQSLKEKRRILPFYPDYRKWPLPKASPRLVTTANAAQRFVASNMGRTSVLLMSDRSPV